MSHDSGSGIEHAAWPCCEVLIDHSPYSNATRCTRHMGHDSGSGIDHAGHSLQVLSSDERKRYEELEVQGEALLGEDLTRALHEGASLDCVLQTHESEDTGVTDHPDRSLDLRSSPGIFESTEQALNQELEALHANHTALLHHRSLLRGQLGSARSKRKSARRRLGSASSTETGGAPDAGRCPALASHIQGTMEDVLACGEQLGRPQPSGKNMDNLLPLLEQSKSCIDFKRQSSIPQTARSSRCFHLLLGQILRGNSSSAPCQPPNMFTPTLVTASSWSARECISLQAVISATKAPPCLSIQLYMHYRSRRATTVCLAKICCRRKCKRSLDV